MSDVVLIYPSLAESHKVSHIPLSVLAPAAPLVDKGFSVRVIDQRIDANWRATLGAELASRPLCVGLSCLTGRQIHYALEAAALVKKANVSVVFGGVHPSLFPEQTLADERVDYVVEGEAESSFLALVEALKAGSVGDIPGIWRKTAEGVKHAPPGDFADPNDLPDMPYDLIDGNDYLAPDPADRQISFLSSRGCPHRCAYCYNTVFNRRRWRPLSAQNTLDRLERVLKLTGARHVVFQDDNFFVDVNRAREICRGMIERNFNITWYATCRIDYLQKTISMEDIELFFRSGLSNLAFGIETGSDRMLKMITKDVTRQQVIDVNRMLASRDFAVKYVFMVGLPGETVDDMMETTDLMQRLKRDNRHARVPIWRFFTPYPGTACFDESVKLGFNPPGRLEDWADFEFTEWQTPWVTDRMKAVARNVAFMLKFLENAPPVRGPRSLLANLYCRTVNWRWRRHWFKRVPEAGLVKGVSHREFEEV